MKKLNLGCGNDIRQGYINLDIAPLEGVDIVHNIEILPLPFENESFDEVICQDILEHIDYVPLLKDLHRIMKTGGKLWIRVPHFSSANNYVDPTHKKMFSVFTFEFFSKNSPFGRNYYFDFRFTDLDFCKITFSNSKFLFYNRIIENLCKNKKFCKVYENSFMCRFFPAENIHAQFIK